MAILDDLGVTVGINCEEHCHWKDEKRKLSAVRKASLATKEARIEIRRARLERAEEEEGTL